MVGKGIAGCESGCGCTKSPWTPPPPPTPAPGECDYDWFCEFDPETTTFLIEFEASADADPTCFICDPCSTTPFDIELSYTSTPGGFYWPTDCDGDIEGTTDDLTIWWDECNDQCVLGDYYGAATIEKDCEVDIDDVICTSPPYPTDGTIITGVTRIQCYLRVFQDGCYRLAIMITTMVPCAGGTIKPDPTDPNSNVIAGGSYNADIFTYTGTLACCSATSLSAGPYSANCLVASTECGAACAVAVTSTPMEMVCV